MARHAQPPGVQVDLPEWVVAEAKNPKGDMCLVSAAEDAYTALGFAKFYGADQHDACKELLRAGEKSLKTMANPKAKKGLRCSAGDRAARKFWEAKVCARRSA